MLFAPYHSSDLLSFKELISNPTLNNFISQLALDHAGEGLDLIIMPGIAFDDNGGRLGRGKGYYDRYIDKVQAVHKKLGKPMPELIALAFDEQIVDSLPISPTDRHVDHVFHPKKLQ